MLKIKYSEVVGWENAIRGMRNPMNSWAKSDSGYYHKDGPSPQTAFIGPNDYALMKKLAKAGTDHRKFMRMIVAYVDIVAPLYW